MEHDVTLPYRLPPKIEALKRSANEAFSEKRLSNAIDLYNLAVLMLPDSAVLLSNRAAALMRRNWSAHTVEHTCLSVIA